MSDVFLSDMERQGKLGCPGMGARYVKWDIFKVNVTQATNNISIGLLVNGITIKNNGTTNVIFKGEPLVPGESQTIGGNEGEIYNGRVDISFVEPVPAPATVVNSCWITIKYYLDESGAGQY